MSRLVGRGAKALGHEMRLTIAIPTISTRPQSCLLGTLESLVASSNDDDRKDFRVVVQDADLGREDAPPLAGGSRSSWRAAG